MADNVSVLNLARTLASAEYNSRIPVATQDNIAEISEIITSYPTTKNEFITVLTNQIGKNIYLNQIYKNPFSFMNCGQLPFGKSIEMVFVDIIKSKNFNENFGSENTKVGSLLTKEDMSDKVKVSYFTENYRHKYKITISDEQLRGAFRDNNGLQNLINMILITPINSKEFDQYLLCKQALCNAEIQSETITGFTSMDENQQAKVITKKVRTYVEKFKFMTDNFNAGAVHTFTRPEDIVVFVTPETKALLDVELLASSFNMDKAKLIARIITIDNFTKLDTSTTGTGKNGDVVEDTECLAIVSDKKLIQNYGTLNTSESIRNPEDLETNSFYHDWGLVAVCPYVNAIKLLSN